MDTIHCKLYRRPNKLGWFVAVLLALMGNGVLGQTPDLPATNRSGSKTVANTLGCGSHRIGEVAVTLVRNIPIVTVVANDIPLTLMLDTGAERTVLTPAANERIKGRPPQIAFQRQVRGVAGSVPSNEVELRSFVAGSTTALWRRIVVAPITIPTNLPIQLDGLLGADALSDFDIDLDLPQHRMAFYQKQTCPHAAPAWTLPYSIVDTGRSRGEHLFFPVRLDGREISGFLDTGADISTLAEKKAMTFGITDAVLARDPSITLLGATVARLSSRLHRFSQLQVGTEVIRNPELAVADFDLHDADIVIGNDFLGSRRIWLSYGSRRIFLARR